MPAGSESAQSEAFGNGRDAMGAKTGPRDSLEAELADLERDWEDLERATAQTAAQDKVPLVASQRNAICLMSAYLGIMTSVRCLFSQATRVLHALAEARS